VVEIKLRAKERKASAAHNYHVKQMRVNYAEYSRRSCERSMRSRKNNPERHLAAVRARRKKHVDEKNYYCVTCRKPFTTNNWYKKHFETALHKRMLELNKVQIFLHCLPGAVRTLGLPLAA
jgi:hypothetical protein